MAKTSRPRKQSNLKDRFGAKHPRFVHGDCVDGVLSREYITWCAMKSRCYNRKNNRWKSYGGRIKVCERWIDSFANFLADMGRKPTPQHSIDRVDNNGDYCPENCRWALPVDQQRNTSRSSRLTARGQTLTPPEWEAVSGVSAGIIRKRIKRGWSVDDAIFQPSGTRLMPPYDKSHKRRLELVKELGLIS